MDVVLSLVVAIVAIALLIVFAGPRLDSRWPNVTVPRFDDLAELSAWLANKETAVPGLIDDAGACIQFANPQQPARTRLCFVYVHGFSATWQETAPVTERIAQAFDANVLEARLAGHGTDPETMITPAEDWLRSMAETWEIAAQLGEQVVIVATSTGAPLSIWLALQPQVRDRIHALLLMSPNFRIRSKMDFLLTAPLSKHWIHLAIGREREWEPENAAQAKYWTYRYSTLALIEMQKSVAWFRKQRLAHIDLPVAMMYMRNDPTIDPAAVIAAYARWGTHKKALIPVTLDGDAPDHVFCGDIVGSHRTDWVVAQFSDFLRTLA